MSRCGCCYGHIQAIVDANRTRKDFVAESILKRQPECVEVIVYEPVLQESTFFNSKVINNLDEFKASCCMIVSNRLTEELQDVAERVYTRDLFGSD